MCGRISDLLTEIITHYQSSIYETNGELEVYNYIIHWA